MKVLPILALSWFSCFFVLSARAQTIVNTGFENAGAFPPPGWSYSGSTSYLFATSGTGGSPTTTGPHGGTYYCEFNSYSLSSGSTTTLVSPVVDWTSRGGVATSVTIWWWRDVASYNTATYNLEGVTAYVNTSPTTTGATTIGVVPRRGGLAISGGALGTSTTTTSGWYQYTFPIPNTFNSATNYIIFKFTSKFGDNCFMDDVQWTAYPPVCTGTPAPGTAAATQSTGCGPYATTLSLTGYTAATGIGTQWQSAPDVSGSPGTFTNIAGATNASYTPTVSTTTWYRNGVSCSYSGLTAYSNQLQIVVNPVPTAISGPAAVCEGANIALASTPTGGAWSSSSTANGTIDAVAGILTGIAGGSTTVTYTAPDGCITTSLKTINFAPTPISIAPATAYTVCLGSSATPTANSNQPVPTNLIYQDFNSGMTGAVGGTWTVVNTGASSPYNWAITAPTGYSDEGYSGDGSPYMNTDADIAGSSVTLNTSLISPSFSTVGYGTVNLSFNYYCFSSSTYDAAAEIDYSTDGGVTWNLLYNYFNTLTGVTSWTAGTPTQIIALPSGALGQPNVKLRWYYVSTYGFYWVLDNVIVSVPTTPLPSTAFSWSGISGATGLSCTNCATPTITPGVTGTNVYSVTATYVGCTRTSGVSITANQPGVIGGNTPLCLGGSTITLTNPVSGGTWSSSAPGVATVNSTSGVVSSVSPGITTISYTLPPSCTVTAIVTVNPSPVVSSFSTVATNPCSGQSSSVTLSSSLVPGTYTVNYSLSGATVSAGNTVSMVVSGSSGSFSTVALTTPGATTVTINSVTNSFGCTVPVTTGNTALFTVNPLPAAISGNPVVCYGLTSALTDAGGGTWSSSSTAVATVGSSSGIMTGISGGNATITYTLPTGCLTSLPVTVNQTPAITGVSGACIGNTAVLSDPATGGSWSSNNIFIATVGSTGVFTGVSLGTAIISYTLPSTGCSSGHPVTITSPPSVYAVSGGGSFCPGGTGVPVGMSGSDIGFTYQLYLGGVATGLPVSGVGGALSFGLKTATGIYTVVANPGTTCATNMSGAAPVSLYPLPAVYSVTGGGAYCTGGTGVHIYLSASNPGISYQLLNGLLPSGSPVAGSGTVVDFGLITSGGNYSVLATDNITTCTNNMSGTVTVTLNTLPVAFSVTGGGAYCAGGSGVSVGLSGSVTGNTYQLYRGGLAVGAPVAGTGSAITFGSQAATGSYTVVATNIANGCTNNMTGSVNVSLTSPPALNTVTGGGAFCVGGTGVHIGLNGSTSGINYQAYIGGLPVGGIVSGSGAALDLGLFTTAGTYTVVASVPSSTCTSNMIGNAVVTVNPSPFAFNVTGGGPYCTGGAGVHVGLSGSAVGTNYYLFNTGVLSGASYGTGAPLDFGSELAAGVYIVSASILATGCTLNMNGSATITVNSLPVAFAVSLSTSGSYCAGTVAPHVLLSGSASGTSYQLFINGVASGSPLSGGSALDFGAQPSAGVYTVKGTTTATGCQNTMTGSPAITVNPLPTAYVVSGGGSYCSGSAGVHVGLSSSDTGVSYQLLVNGSPTGGLVSGTGSSLDFGLNTAGGTYTVSGTRVSTSCTRNMTGSVAINPLPLPVVYTMIGGGAYCSGGSGSHIGLSGSNTGISYQLYNGSLPVGSPVSGIGGSLDFGLQTVAGTYSVSAVNTSTGCSANMSGSPAVSVNPLPTSFAISGGGNYCPGGAGVHIGMAGSSAGVTYQLYNTGVFTGIQAAGTGSAIDFGTIANTGSYTVIGINTATTCSNLMPGSTSVALYALPASHTVTGGGNFYCAGGPGVHVGLNGSDIGINYQLLLNSVITGGPVAGTGGTVDFGLQASAGTYTVVAINPATSCSGNMTGSASITAVGLPVAYTITGGGNYCPGSSGVVIGLSGSDATSGVNYRLYLGTVAVGSPVAGTGSALSFGPQTVAGTYTVRATNTANGCSNTMSGATSVNISSLPMVHNVSGTGSYCAGAAGLHVQLDGSEPGVNYTLWDSGLATPVVMPGTGSPLDFGVQTNGIYTVKATGAVTGCSVAMAGNAIVTANSLPHAFNVGGGGVYCGGGSGLAISLSGSASGISYRLLAGGSPVGSPVLGTGAAISFGLQTPAGIYTIAATDLTTSCANDMNGTATISINPAPAAFNVTGGGPYCATGSGADVRLSGSNAGVRYQMYLGTVAAGGPLYGTGAPLDFGNQTVAGSYSVKAIDLTTGCSATMNGAADVSVLPLPAAYGVTGGGTVCPGGTGVHVDLSGSSSGVSYQLYNSGTAIGSAVLGTGLTIDFGAESTAGSYTVIATDAVTGCTGLMSGSATLTSGIPPVAYSLTGSSLIGYCAGGTGVVVYLPNSDAGVSYQLYRGTTPVGSTLAGTGGYLSFGSQSVVGSYSVTGVNTSTGCSNSMNGNVLVSINALPDVYNVTGGGGYCAGGAGVHIGLSGSHSGISYQLYHSGIAIGAAVPGTGSSVDLGIATIAGSYTVLATNSFSGCTSTMSGTATVSLLPAPSAFSVTGGGNFCSGAAGLPVGLSSSSIGVGYQLYRNGTATGVAHLGSGAPVDFGLQTLSGTYTVIGTSSASGCTQTMTGSATVNSISLPAAHAVNGGGSFCAGGTGVEVGLTGSNTGIVYHLYNGSTLVGSGIAGNGFSLTFGQQTAPGIYTVIGADATSTCISTMPGSAAVIVDPVPDIFPVTGGGAYCAGSNGVHVGLAGSSSGITYSLMQGGAVVASHPGSGAALDFGLQTTAGNYTVQAANNATGCMSNMSGSAAVAITPVVAAAAAISSGIGDTICSGTLTTFSASMTGGGTSPSFQWTINGIVTGTGSSYSYIPVNGDVVGVTCTSSAACAVPSVVNATAAITVWPSALPSVTISADPGTEVCRGSTVLFTATPAFGGSSPSYTWMKGSTVVGSGPTYSFVPQNGDAISCELTSSYQCRQASTATSPVATMVVDTPATPVVTLSAYPGLNITVGETLTLEATVTNGGPAPSFSWMVNGIAVSNAHQPTFSGSNFANGDIVTCDVLSSGGCAGIAGSKSVTLHVNNVGVKPLNSSTDDISVLPNPNNGTFLVRGTLGLDITEVKLIVTDVLGQQVYAETAPVTHGILNQSITLNKSLANGMYLLTLTNGSDVKVFHIVVKQ